MKQAVMTSPGVIAFRDVPVPELGEREVLVRMKRIGVCGSDIHVYHGKHPLTPYPVVQGHEVSGAVEKVGRKVTSFHPGEKVTIQPQVYCGSCYPCRHGAYHVCDNLKVMGFQTTGAASELFAVDEAKLLRLPDSMSYEQGAMIEPLAVAVHAVERGGDVAGKRVLVLGAGPIGNLTAQAAKALGAAVMITDLSENRLRIARECGVDFPVNTGREELADAIRRDFGPDKADLILECVGARPTIEQAIALARKGSDIIIVGVFGERPPVDLALVQDRELRLIGTLMYQTGHWQRAIELVERGAVRLEPLLTDSFPFGEYKRAYERIEADRDATMKVMIRVDE